MKKILITLATAGMVGAGMATAAPAPAQNCQWDPAWFFGVGCNPVPTGPPLPPERRQYHPTKNPQGYPWAWEKDPGVKHWCPPECI
jgi:hypothetical protein